MQQTEMTATQASKPHQPYVLEGLRLSVAPMMDWIDLVSVFRLNNKLRQARRIMLHLGCRAQQSTRECDEWSANALPLTSATVVFALDDLQHQRRLAREPSHA